MLRKVRGGSSKGLGRHTSFPYRKAGHDIAIFPEMRLGIEDGIRVVNPVSEYEVWLNGNIDYSVTQYRVERDNRGLFPL